MSKQYFEPAISTAKGGGNVILGLVDVASRKFMKFSIKGLLHISQERIHLFKKDLDKEQDEKREEDLKCVQ